MPAPRVKDIRLRLRPGYRTIQELTAVARSALPKFAMRRRLLRLSVATAGDQRLCGSPFQWRLSSVMRLLETPKFPVGR
jgi:hypothetical protein